MTKTSLDIATQALRNINVTPVGEAPEADDRAQAVASMQAILDELNDTHGITVAWTIEAVPDALFEPFSWAVAAHLSPVYQRQARVPRSRAMMMLRASLLPDDRADRADLDDSGAVSTEEADADLRAQYY